MKPFQAPEIQKAFSMEQYSSYTYWVYTAHNDANRIIDPSGIYPRIHFLAGSNTDDVTKVVTYGFCGSITSSPGNREILGLHKSIIEAVKKFRKSSRSDIFVLKFLSAIPEMLPTPAPSWLVVQLCMPNKANSKFGKNKNL